uniref:RING-type domain-containing protein n=1 Tax=Caenorhabditis tropicalis TaxID=1561998 RepID=A0A1I7TK66_9PELO
MEDILGNFEMATVISCPVCRDLYNLTDQHPVNIPCGHTFCHQCLQALSNLKVPLLMCPSQCDFIKGFGNRTPRMPRVSLPGPHPLLPRPAAGDENVRLVVRFAEAAGAVGHARLQEVANQARAAAEIRNLAGPEQPINGDARVIIFNDMLRGIFRVIDDVANPAGNEEVHIPDDEPNGENELNAGGNQVVNDDAVAIVAAQDVRELQNVEAVDRGAEVEEEDVDARPVVEMLIDDEPPAPMDVPEIEPVPRQLRARIRPQQQVEEAVPANAEPEVRRERRAARRDRGIPIRHDPVQRDRQNNGNARGRRPARR